MVKRYDMEKEYSLDINIVPVEEHDGAFVHYDDYAELLEALQKLLYVHGNMGDARTWSINESPEGVAARAAIDKALGETK